MASARLEVPDRRPCYGRDRRCAMLILHVEPHDTEGAFAPTEKPEVWANRFACALEIPEILARFLGGLSLRTSGEPPAQLGVRLQSPGDIAEMIDITGLKQLPGGQHSSEVISFLIAEPNGSTAKDAAIAMMKHTLLYALKAEGRPINAFSDSARTCAPGALEVIPAGETARQGEDERMREADRGRENAQALRRWRVQCITQP